MIDTIWLKLYTSHVCTNTNPQVKYESAAVNSSQDNELINFFTNVTLTFPKAFGLLTDGQTDRRTDIPTYRPT